MTTSPPSRHTVPFSLDEETAFTWPKKAQIFDVYVSVTTYAECVELVTSAARRRMPATVTCYPVHALMCTVQDRSLAEKINTFDVVTPDGQPVRWAMNWLNGTKLTDRVYGPELMWRLCKSAAQEGIGVYLYGSRPEVIARLRENLCRRIAGLSIVGTESPPFRALTAKESCAAIQRINDSGAGLVFVGLGSPKQDHFAFEHRNSIQAVQVCVGAAFDFHAGTLRMAPRWMQRRGLEWAFRLASEPRRLWKRYLVANSRFLMKLSIALLGRSIKGSLQLLVP